MTYIMTIHIELDRLEYTLNEIEKSLPSIEPEKSFKIMLICEEMIVNLLEHADFQGKTPDITLSINPIDKDKIELIFRENAKPFNLLTFPEPDTDIDIDERRQGGLGIYLIKKYAESVEYRYEKGYNIFRIIV